ncbi:MAG: NAD(P)H-binding protein [Solirubrobacteraceae bacterium]|jgi:uncharacterized protein YbjT (DUF2867 family)
MRILVTGASGFVGSLLVPRLRADGHALRALGRDPERVRLALAPMLTCERWQPGEVDVVRADVRTGDGLAQALGGVELAYYLIHSMERSVAERSTFAERERVAAESFAAAAARAGVRRIVYLGGLTPRAVASPESTHADTGATAVPPPTTSERADTRISRHLASRAQVERVLLEAVPDSLALRASIVIGARSRSFRLLVHLLERMPVLTLPAWQTLRTQPIDARDVIEMLAACATAQLPRRSLDVGGPDVLTYGEMLRAIAELMLVNRPTIKLGVNLTGVTARLAAAIAGEDPELVLPLMEGLQYDLLPAEHHAAELLGVRLHSFESAVEHALAEWERSEPLAAR